MRKNQVSIKVERFGDQVPPEVGATHQVISVYADSNEFSIALFEALHELMDQVEGRVKSESATKFVDVCNLGVFTESVTPSQRRHAAMDAVHKIKSAIEKLKFEISYAENIEAIAHIIATSSNKTEAVRRFYEELDFIDEEYQARRCFGASPVFATCEEIESKKKELVEMEERLAIAQAQLDAIDESGI